MSQHSGLRDWGLMADLARAFPKKYIARAPQGKHGTYINHADITQRLLAIHGPYSFEIVEVIRGHAPIIQSEKNTFEARENAILGCLGRLTLTDRWGNDFTITEVGTEDNPAMSHDAENLKNAASDAFKRCAMRLGLGLELWAKNGYHLPDQVATQLANERGETLTREPVEAEDAEPEPSEVEDTDENPVEAA